MCAITTPKDSYIKILQKLQINTIEKNWNF